MGLPWFVVVSPYILSTHVKKGTENHEEVCKKPRGAWILDVYISLFAFTALVHYQLLELLNI